MKIRTDYVTNSSSSSYICLRIPESEWDEILMKNGISESNMDEAYMSGEPGLILDGNLYVDFGEGRINYIGMSLDECDFEDKTLREIREGMIETVHQVYGIELTKETVQFDYGETYH